MMKLLAITALVASAMAAEYESEVDDNADVWDLEVENSENVKATANLVARVSAIESAMVPIQSSVELAQSSMERLDAIVAEVASLKRTLVIDVAAIDKKLSESADADALNYHRDEAIKNAWSIQAAGRAARGKMITRIAAAKDLAAKTQTRANKNIIGKIAAMEKDVNKQMKAVLDNMPYQRSDEHIFQVTGFRPDEIEKYWDGKVYKSKSSDSQVRDRLFYRVKYNVVRPGYWTSNNDEMLMACHALSVHLYRQDGIERDLRPPCNHYGHHTWGGLGQCIFIMRSYFSHCGGSSSGYWRMEEACGGVPEPAIRNVPCFEDCQHNYDRHLVHYSPNHHGWRDPYNQQGYDYQLCTGGNQNFKK
jgi:hypothetical protein